MAKSERATTILEASERWRDDCLLGEGSIFTSEALWTHPNAESLQKYYSHNLDLGDGDFFQKFEGQLEEAPPAAAKLAAEILWVMYLIVSKTASSAATKRLQIKQVFGWSGSEIADDHWAIGTVLEKGVAHPGTGYQTHRWRELVFFIDFLLEWTSVDPEEKSRLLSQPWAFSEWLETIEGSSRRQLPHVLCFLLFPDSFERIASSKHKSMILESFQKELSAAPKDYSSRTDLDRGVLEVREALTEAYGPKLDFYDSELKAIWRPAQKPLPVQDEISDGTEDAQWLEKRFSGHRVWLLAAGEGGRLWPDMEKAGIAAIGWDYLGDIEHYENRDQVTKAIAEESGKANPTNDSLAVWEFARVMEPGDVILAKKGSDTLLAHGIVTGPYAFDDGRPEYHHTRTVDWTPVPNWQIPEDQRPAIKTLTDFTKYPSWVRAAFSWADASSESTDRDDGDSPASYTVEDALAGVFLTKPDFQEILDSLARRKNLILEGPPGVGKTFIARRIAWALIGAKSPRNVEFVQFHQSYAYEDFIQGFRPKADGGFELRDGVFLQFCRKASESDEPHVFIIDEINRGNLSRIFGELMMLIEADKRGRAHQMRLTYSPTGERFFVPENVHLLGMMNTADRSLAMVDYALRRRFAFFPLKPAFGSESFSAFLLEKGVDENLVRSIDQRFRTLNQSIREDAQNLGPGFQVGHSYFVPSGEETALDEQWYRSIVRTQILPLLREYWFDRPQVLAKNAEALGIT